jgi:hypothetical protein
VRSSSFFLLLDTEVVRLMSRRPRQILLATPFTPTYFKQIYDVASYVRIVKGSSSFSLSPPRKGEGKALLTTNFAQVQPARIPPPYRHQIR